MYVCMCVSGRFQEAEECYKKVKASRHIRACHPSQPAPPPQAIARFPKHASVLNHYATFLKTIKVVL